MEPTLESALGDDASQLAATEKQLLLSRLLARLAHEIRNPLSSLDIHVQLLEEDLGLQVPALREKLSGRLEIIHGELHRLENVVKQFLRLTGPSSLELEQVDINALLQRVIELLKPELEQREIEIAAAVKEAPILQADASQLTQALLNLVINAAQAIDRRGRIELGAVPSDGFLNISVSDTGPGIPAGKLTAIFEPYFTTKPDGNGLGLWIAWQIALAHGGGIRAANGPVQGAVFVMKLPLRRDQP